MDRLCIWSQTVHPESFIINSPVRECWMQERVLGLCYSADASRADDIWEQHTFLIRIAGRSPFEVKGESLDDDERIVLTGQAPRVGRNCRPYESYTTNLEFRRANLDDANHSQDAVTAALPQAIASKPERTYDEKSTEGAEVPSAPPPQHRARNATPSTAKDSSANLVDARHAAATAQTSVPNETRSTREPDKYLWGAAFIVVIVWLLIKLFGRMLIRMK
jgi:hypothetical protein